MLVPGAWDFAGVLFAASGFLLLGGPVILNGLYEGRRFSWLLGRLQFMPHLGEDEWYFWVSVWAFYYLAVIGGAALLLWARSHTTSVYNADTELLERGLKLAAKRLGLTISRFGNRFILTLQPEHLEGPNGSAPTTNLPIIQRVLNVTRPSQARPSTLAPSLETGAESQPSSSTLALDLEPFHAARHVLMVWHMAPRSLRRQLEMELEIFLEQVRVPPSPAAVWLLLAASIFLGMIFLGLVAFFALLFLSRSAYW